MNRSKTEFEENHWELALAEIPAGTEIVSIEETNCRVDMIGIFYRVPGQKRNNYMRAMTKRGRHQAKNLSQYDQRIEKL